MKIENRTFRLPLRAQETWLESLGKSLSSQLAANMYPLRFSIVEIGVADVVVEATLVLFEKDEPFSESLTENELLSPRKRTHQADKFGIVQIIPTGIRCDFGGYAGDATPATNLLAKAADFVITHPNAVNASDINELSENVLYVEGKSLDDVLLGHLGLRPRVGQRIGTFIDPTGLEMSDSVMHAMNAGLAAAGIRCDLYSFLDRPLGVSIEWTESGCASGKVLEPLAILEGTKALLRAGASAIGGVSVIHGVTKEMCQKHLRGEIPNPSGVVEAIITHLVSKIFRVPTAHAPLPYYTNVKDRSTFNPRASAEFISTPHYFCVLKGLHRAPDLVAIESPAKASSEVITLNHVGAIICPATALGGIPALSAEFNNIPLIAVKDNTTILSLSNDKMKMRNVIEVSSYLEATGVVHALKAGIAIESLRRPLNVPQVVREISVETDWKAG